MVPLPTNNQTILVLYTANLLITSSIQQELVPIDAGLSVARSEIVVAMRRAREKMSFFHDFLSKQVDQPPIHEIFYQETAQGHVNDT